jgi:hypothetical protein
MRRLGQAQPIPDEPIAALSRPTSVDGEKMANFSQYLGLAFGIAVVALGMSGFFRGLSLPPNPPEHRAHGKGDNWRT